MGAAVKEKADGHPTKPSNEHERIVSQWIAPVRLALGPCLPPLDQPIDPIAEPRADQGPRSLSY